MVPAVVGFLTLPGAGGDERHSVAILVDVGD
jgi:hypothetical protein